MMRARWVLLTMLAWTALSSHNIPAAAGRLVDSAFTPQMVRAPSNFASDTTRLTKRDLDEMQRALLQMAQEEDALETKTDDLIAKTNRVATRDENDTIWDARRSYNRRQPRPEADRFDSLHQMDGAQRKPSPSEEGQGMWFDISSEEDRIRVKSLFEKNCDLGFIKGALFCSAEAEINHTALLVLSIIGVPAIALSVVLFFGWGEKGPRRQAKMASLVLKGVKKVPILKKLAPKVEGYIRRISLVALGSDEVRKEYQSLARLSTIHAMSLKKAIALAAEDTHGIDLKESERKVVREYVAELAVQAYQRSQRIRTAMNTDVTDLLLSMADNVDDDGGARSPVGLKDVVLSKLASIMPSNPFRSDGRRDLERAVEERVIEADKDVLTDATLQDKIRERALAIDDAMVMSEEEKRTTTSGEEAKDYFDAIEPANNGSETAIAFADEKKAKNSVDFEDEKKAKKSVAFAK